MFSTIYIPSVQGFCQVAPMIPMAKLNLKGDRLLYCLAPLAEWNKEGISSIVITDNNHELHKSSLY